MSNLSNIDMFRLLIVSTLEARLKAAIKNAGLKPIELARRAGISRATVSLWLNGQTKNIAGDNLVRVARVLGVQPSDLTGDTEFHVREIAAPYAIHATDENKLISRYRMLNEVDKERALAMIDILLKIKKR